MANPPNPLATPPGLPRAATAPADELDAPITVSDEVDPTVVSNVDEPLVTVLRMGTSVVLVLPSIVVLELELLLLLVVVVVESAVPVPVPVPPVVVALLLSATVALAREEKTAIAESDVPEAEGSAVFVSQSVK